MVVGLAGGIGIGMDGTTGTEGLGGDGKGRLGSGTVGRGKDGRAKLGRGGNENPPVGLGPAGKLKGGNEKPPVGLGPAGKLNPGNPPVGNANDRVGRGKPPVGNTNDPVGRGKLNAPVPVGRGGKDRTGGRPTGRLGSTDVPGKVVARLGVMTLPPGRVDGGMGRMGIVVGSVNAGAVDLDELMLAGREGVGKIGGKLRPGRLRLGRAGRLRLGRICASAMPTAIATPMRNFMAATDGQSQPRYQSGKM